MNPFNYNCHHGFMMVARSDTQSVVPHITAVSTSVTYWKLKKTLYGLVRLPMHWYNNICTFFKSIGLNNSPNSPCLFTGTLIQGEPPLYLGLYVDDFAYFSTSDKVEQKFKQLMNTKYSVSYEDSLDWFLGMKFDWLETDTALKCHVHQEAFILDTIVA